MNHFTIAYPEHHIADLLQVDFPKRDNFSISIPLSRQQKHYDLLLFNANNKKCLTIQVKSSRTYLYPEITKSNQYNYYAWLSNFNIVNNYSDYYFIFISFPVFDTESFKPKAGFGTKILVFDSSEMSTILGNINITKGGTPDRFFALGFNFGENRIFGDRGFDKNNRPDLSEYLYENKLPLIKQAIN